MQRLRYRRACPAEAYWFSRKGLQRYPFAWFTGQKIQAESPVSGPRQPEVALARKCAQKKKIVIFKKGVSKVYPVT
jgi:hypothetical protein